MENNVWYLRDEYNRDIWHKLLYLRERSGLSDEFEFMEDYTPIDKEGSVRHKKGMTLTMDYGVMENWIKKGDLKK